MAPPRVGPPADRVGRPRSWRHALAPEKVVGPPQIFARGHAPVALGGARSPGRVCGDLLLQSLEIGGRRIRRGGGLRRGRGGHGQLIRRGSRLRRLRGDDLLYRWRNGLGGGTELRCLRRRLIGAFDGRSRGRRLGRLRRGGRRRRVGQGPERGWPRIRLADVCGRGFRTRDRRRLIRLDLHRRRHARDELHVVRNLIDVNAHRHTLGEAHEGEDWIDRGESRSV